MSASLHAGKVFSKFLYEKSRVSRRMWVSRVDFSKIQKRFLRFAQYP